jgi:hypothetical protein
VTIRLPVTPTFGAMIHARAVRGRNTNTAMALIEECLERLPPFVILNFLQDSTRRWFVILERSHQR